MAFWRNFIRKKTKPLDQNYARKMKNHLTAMYFFVTWNLFGLAVYKWTKESLPARDENLESSSSYYSRVYGMTEGTAYRFKDFKFVEKFHVMPPGKKPMEKTDDMKNDEKTVPDENLELLVEEAGSL